jgi:hypothetical protein
MTDRLTHGRARLLREQLSKRDLAVLRSLYQLRLLTSSQIQRLHVAEGSRLTQARRTRSVLQRLSELELVVRLPRHVGGTQSGSTAQIYGLSGLGLAVLEVPGPYGRRRRTVWETKPYFAGHVLAVAELCVGLTEVARRKPTVDLLTFDGEPAAWRRFTGPSGDASTLKPDALVRVGVGDYELSAFIELDMGSESLPTLQRKCHVYAAYWRTGSEQHVHGVFPRVLWLVPDATRTTKVRTMLGRLDAQARHLFAVALHNDGPAVLTVPLGNDA